MWRLWFVRLIYLFPLGVGLYALARLLGLTFPDFMQLGENDLLEICVGFLIWGIAGGLAFETWVRITLAAKKRERRLRTHGTRVSATVDSMEPIESHPDRNITNFRLVLTGSTHVFTVEDLPVELAYIPRIQPDCIVTVYQNPRDPTDFIIALDESPPRQA